MKVTKFFLILLIAITLFLGLGKKVLASEGTSELASTTGANYRCFVASIRTDKYNVLIGCEGLVYPSGRYILWVTTDEGKTVKLGSLDYGRKMFKVGKAFTDLFVTLENNAKVKSPAGTVVMRGLLQPISFLERPPTPTSVSEKTEDKDVEDTEEVEDEAQEEEKETEKTSTKDKLLTALKRAGIAALFALVALIGLIFIITKARG